MDYPKGFGHFILFSYKFISYLHSQFLLGGFLLLVLIVKAKIIVLSFRFGHFPVAL